VKADPEPVMHVAAPVPRRRRILGVLVVAKPMSTMQPFIDRAERKIFVGRRLAAGPEPGHRRGRDACGPCTVRAPQLRPACAAGSGPANATTGAGAAR
jgi:hypothetical protein